MKRQSIFVRIATACTLVLSALLSAAPADASRLIFVTVDCAALPLSGVEGLALLPHVDGLALEIPWSRIESTPGKYNWTFLDGAIRSAATHKKYVTLYFTGSPKLPIWLTEGGKVQTFACGNFARGLFVDAVPWDKNYLDTYTGFLRAAAVHLKSLNMTPYVFAVGVVAPQRDCTIEGSINGRLGSIPYNRDTYFLACKQMVDTYARIFPSTRKFLPAPRDTIICSPMHDREFYFELLNYALSKHGKSCWMYSRDLSSAGSHNTSGYSEFGGRTGLAYQIPAATAQEENPANINRAANIGMANGAMYFEISAGSMLTRDNAMFQTIEEIHHK